MAKQQQDMYAVTSTLSGLNSQACVLLGAWQTLLGSALARLQLRCAAVAYMLVWLGGGSLEPETPGSMAAASSIIALIGLC